MEPGPTTEIAEIYSKVTSKVDLSPAEMRKLWAYMREKWGLERPPTPLQDFTEQVWDEE